MSLLNWLKPPMKHSYMENSDSEEEDKPEEGDNDMTSYMISGLTNNSIARDASTTSNSKPSCSKQSKSFNTVWVKRRKHWLKYEKGVGMFCLLCQNMISIHIIKMYGIKIQVQGLDCRIFLTMKKCSSWRQREDRE